MTEQEYKEMQEKIDEYDAVQGSLNKVRDLMFFVQRLPEEQLRIRLENLNSGSFRAFSNATQLEEALRRRVIEVLTEDLAIYEGQLLTELEEL